MRRHTTHFDDCGCMTLRYKIALNALMAIHRHFQIVGRKMAPLSTAYTIADRAISSLQKFDPEENRRPAVSGKGK